MTILECAECGAPAEVRDEFTLPSTDGPVRHVVTSCVNRHHLTVIV